MQRSFTQTFRSLVAQQPDDIAILTDGEDKLSYAQLDARAQNVAAAIAKLPDGLIAISIEKSADYIAALLGCWYAGKAFLPLDPALPQARLQWILQDARPVAILTRKSYSDLFTGTQPLLIEDLRDQAYSPQALHADACAYVIYTSGSTGNPKGVVVTHAGLTSVIEAQITAFDLKRGDRSLFYLSISFDASLSDIGTALLSGATLCIETKSKLELVADLSNVIAQRSITFMDIPPSLLRLLRPQDMPAHFRTIVIGGEPCTPQTVRDWARHLRVINVYGPTEATICTSMCLCDADTWDKPLIGNPLPDVAYHIFDEALNEVDEGQLYIGGAQLAVGYLNNEALTAQKFITHKGKRLYRSGDHVRRLPNGDIEFIGRIDRQVKVNGQLVELAEVEARIAPLKGVQRAAVIKHAAADGAGGRESLVAFIATKENAALPVTYFRAMLSRDLPPWMIPAQFIPLPLLPETPSGKVDYKQLRDALTQGSASAESAPFTPDGARQTALLTAWRHVLKRRDIGGDDNFFALGGDSFAVLELSLKASTLGLSLSPGLIADHPTLAAQAALLDENYTIASASDALDADILRKDVAADIGPIAPPQHTAARASPAQMTHVFFTGATGFMGGYLLRKLLEDTSCVFHVLVRAPDAETARQRLSLPARYAARINPLCGDLSQERFGLSDVAWESLADTVDTIVHCGAIVNMAASYADLRSANVRGTAQVLRLAQSGRPKFIHYASTLSVFVATDRNSGTLYEDDRLENVKKVYGGYAQSKWAAEHMLLQAQARGWPLAIYRLGLITGDSQTDQSSSHDFLQMFAKGLRKLGSLPLPADNKITHDRLAFDVTPVDYAARVMCALIAARQEGTYHIAHGEGTLQDLAQVIAENGSALPLLPAAQWQAAIESRFTAQPPSPEEAAAFMALCRCLPPPLFERYRSMDLFQKTGVTFDKTNTNKILEPAKAITPPNTDKAILAKYLQGI